MNPSQTLRGVLWMGGAVLSFSAMAIAARELLAHMQPFQVLFVRSMVMLAIVLVIVAQADPGAAGTRRLPLHALRNLVHFGGQYCWVFAIGALPLATVFAIEFTMPVWTAILAAALLGERLNRGRAVMLVLGLAGVLIILRPGSGFFQLATLVALAAAFLYAGNMIATKRLSATEPPLAVLFWMSVMQTPLSLVAALPQWVAPPVSTLPWIMLIGVGSYTAHYCMTRAFKLADASVVVPIDFTRLPLIAVVGAMFYGEPFDPWIIVGALVIFAGTYYSLRRETR
jgi:drug/metabolite transporter (DMT)-like permease